MHPGCHQAAAEQPQRTAEYRARGGRTDKGGALLGLQPVVFCLGRGDGGYGQQAAQSKARNLHGVLLLPVVASCAVDDY